MIRLKDEIVRQINVFFDNKKIKYDKHLIFSDTIIAYFNTLDKVVIPQPRKVYVSNELNYKLNNEYSKQSCIIDKFKDDFLKGIDMNGHLSRGIYKTSVCDKLLISWNIYHVHLNTKSAKNDSEMKDNRSNLLLFCIITNDKVLFVDIQEHSKDYVFSSYELLKISIENNWIAEINAMEMKDVLPGTLEPKITCDEDINIFRRLNMNSAFEFNNKAYMFLGLNSAGSSVENSLRLCSINRMIYQLENEMVCNFQLAGRKDFLGIVSIEKDGQVNHLRI